MPPEPSADTTTAASAAAASAAADAAERAAFLAEITKPDEGSGDAKPEKPAAEPTGDEPTEDAGADEGEDGEAGSEDSNDDESDETEPKADEETEAGDKPADPDRDKRLAAVQKAERRAKEQLAKERQAAKAEIDAHVAKLEAEWAPRIKAAETFESLKSRARYNTVAVLRELGVGDDDFQRVAYEIYAHSKAPDIKPEQRAHAAAAARERELADKHTATEKRIAQLEEDIKRRDLEAKAADDARRYMATVEKAAGAGTLAKHFLVKSPERTRSRLAQLSIEIWNETGERPSERDLLKRYEEVRRADLEELGIDPATIIKAAPATKAKNGTSASGAVNGKHKIKVVTKTAESLSAKSDEEEREEILRELKQLHADTDD